MRILKLCLLLIVVSAAFAQNSTDRAYVSVRNNDLAALRTLTKDHGLNDKDAEGQTPLMFRGSVRQPRCNEVADRKRSDAKAVSEAGVTALHLAVGDVRKVRLLLESGADVNKASLVGRTPLLVAAGTYGSIDTVRLLLDRGAAVNAADTTGLTPIVAAAGVNDAAVVKLLVEKGANINARATVGAAVTALMGAAGNGNAELTRLLLGPQSRYPCDISRPIRNR
jgi:hypothetical protein